jgi:hypothetical protein
LEDKTPAIVAMLVVLLLIFLSNTGRLLALKQVIQTTAGDGGSVTPSSGSSVGSDVPSDRREIHGDIGPDESLAGIMDIEHLLRQWSATA